MKVIKPKHFAGIGLLSLAFFGDLVPEAFATDITSLSALGANTIIDWSVTHPASAQSFTVGDVTFSEPSSIFKQLIEGSVGWAGNFPTGTYVEYNQEPIGPTTFTFAAPLEGFGLTLNNDFGGSFTTTIAEFDGATSLGSNSTTSPQGTLVFLGVLDPTFDITSVTIDTAGIGGNHAFAFSNVNLVEEPSSSAPEPAAAGLVGIGVVLIMLFLRPRVKIPLNVAVRMLLVCSACLLSSAAAFANETYTYTGNAYASCSGTYASQVMGAPPGACASTYSVTGSFTTTLSLSALENLTNYKIPFADVLSFSFSDGSGLAINQSDADLSASVFEITTNSSGSITSPQGWDVSVVESPSQSNYPMIYTNSCDLAPCIGAYDGSGTSLANEGETAFENPGIWKGPEASAPEVPSVLLLGLGLVAIAGLGTRSKLA